MSKKLTLFIFISSFLLASCPSPDEDPRDNYPQNRDITLTVSSSDNDRMSEITSSIQGRGLEISRFSSGNSHLPLEQEFINKSIPFFTVVNITYRDNSGGKVGVPFEAYDIVLTIRIDSEIKAEKEIRITKSGIVDYVEFIFE
ncbi:hypothetical protein ACV07N_09805 [Roseivirga echinicomitans]